MTGCFSCFGGPRVDNEQPSTSSPAKDLSRPDKRPHGHKAKSNDRAALRLVRSSKKGCRTVLSAVLEEKEASWVTDLNPPTIRARTSALHCALDSLLMSLLEAIESTVGKPGKGGEAGWEGLQLRDIGKMAEQSCQSVTSLNLISVAKGVAHLLNLLGAVWTNSTNHLQTTLGDCFHNPSTNKLLSLVAVVLCRQVTHEMKPVWKQRLSDWLELRNTLGAGGAFMVVSLNPQNKALLAYLSSAASSGELKMTIKVRREKALWDTVRFLQQNRMISGCSGPAKIFPLFLTDQRGSVEAGEGHGPRKEFFASVGAGLVADSAQSGSTARTAPFVYTRSAGQYSLNLSLEDTEANRDLMWASGWLASQTICNRCLLGVPLPQLVFRRLLEGTHFKPSMEELESFDPEAAKAIKNVTRLPDSDFKAMLELEDCAGMSKEHYVRHAVKAAMGATGDSAWVFDSFQDGFWAVLSKSIISDLQVTSSDLAEMTCGMDASDSRSGTQTSVHQIFRVVLDEELGGNGSIENRDKAPAAPLARALWEVVDSWDSDLTQKFVYFVTGSERLPLPGTELLRVELPFVALSSKDHQSMLGMLPQAHTCENILELPNYWEALLRTKHPTAEDAESLPAKDAKKLYGKLLKLLEERLRLAVTACNSYGLDEGVGTSVSQSLNTNASLGLVEREPPSIRSLAPPDSPWNSSNEEESRILPEPQHARERELEWSSKLPDQPVAVPAFMRLPSEVSRLKAPAPNCPGYLAGLFDEPSEIFLPPELPNKRALTPIKASTSVATKTYGTNNFAYPNIETGRPGDVDNLRSNDPTSDFGLPGMPTSDNVLTLTPSEAKQPNRMNSRSSASATASDSMPSKPVQRLLSIEDLINDLGV